MSNLLGIRIRNYKSLADVTLGQVTHKQGEPLPSLMCFIGPNGAGKSTLLDAFAFLGDCLRLGVEAACDQQQRGGFAALRTSGNRGPIQFDLYFKENRKDARPITYEFSVGEQRGQPVVVSETLRQRRQGEKYGQPFPFLKLDHGVGKAWVGKSLEGVDKAESVSVNLKDKQRLGIATLGQLTEHPRIVALREYLESWYLSYFVPDAARRLPVAGAQPHLDRTGENLANVVQFMERLHKPQFQAVLDRIAKRIPGIKKISTDRSRDGRLLLQFNEEGYHDPFYQRSMSDGTLKMFAYLLLLEDPEPPAFIGIEEPENGLYHKLLEQLAREFRRHTERSGSRVQILVTTHSPHFVDALLPEQVWLLEKDAQGRTQAKRTADMELISALEHEGIPLGSLWYSQHLEARFSP